MVWLNLPRSPTGVKAITLQKNRVTGEGEGTTLLSSPTAHPLTTFFTTSRPARQQTRSHCSTASSFLFFLYRCKWSVAIVKLSGSQRASLSRSGVEGGSERSLELQSEHTHTPAHTAILKQSPGYSFCPLSRSFCNLPLLFYSPPLPPTSCTLLSLVQLLTRGDIRIFALIINTADNSGRCIARRLSSCFLKAGASVKILH